MEKVQFKDLSGWLKFAAVVSIIVGIVYILLVVVIFFSLFYMPSVSAYSCIQEEDNQAVRDFKNRINIISVETDLERGMTIEGIKLKLKYFDRLGRSCR